MNANFGCVCVQIMAKHVMKVHINAHKVGQDQEQEGELSLLFLKKYLAYCRA